MTALAPPPLVTPRLPRAAAAMAAGRVATRRLAGPRSADGVQPPSGYRKLFVVGCARSGTTWLLRLLAGHPAVVSTRESHAWRDVAAVYEQPGPAPVRWAKVIRRYDVTAREQPWVGLRWYVDRASFVHLVQEVGGDPSLADADASDELIERVFDTFFALRASRATDLFVEKTPAHLAVGDRILRRFPQAKLVEVVRDGRDVAVSMDAFATTQQWLPPSRELQAERWARDIATGAALRADPRFSGRIALVRYEDLRRDPARELARLLEFAELDARPGLVQALVDRQDIGRLDDKGTGRPTRTGAVGDWRQVFTAEDVELFDRIAADALVSCGYA